MGLLEVTVVKAKGLPNIQVTSDVDPYCKVKLGHEGQAYESPCVENTTEPTWNYLTKFQVADDNSQQIKIEVWNKNYLQDDFLGEYMMGFDGIQRGVPLERWALLQHCKSSAEVLVRILAVDFGELPDAAPAPAPAAQPVMPPPPQPCCAPAFPGALGGPGGPPWNPYPTPPVGPPVVYPPPTPVAPAHGGMWNLELDIHVHGARTLGPIQNTTSSKIHLPYKSSQQKAAAFNATLDDPYEKKGTLVFPFGTTHELRNPGVHVNFSFGVSGYSQTGVIEGGSLANMNPTLQVIPMPAKDCFVSRYNHEYYCEVKGVRLVRA